MNASRPPLIAGNWKMNPPSSGGAVALARDVRDATAGMPARTVICPAEHLARRGGRGARRGIDRAREPRDRRADDAGRGVRRLHRRDLAADGGRAGAVRHPRPLGAAPVRQRDRCRRGGQGRLGGRPPACCPIACVGELAEERRAGLTATVIERQLRAAISRLDRIAGSGLVIAYEPVWAIGTGDAASGEDAQAAAAQIRAILAESDPAGAEEVPILYGGSCTPDNAAEFFAQPDVDGALVGGASLNAAGFARIVRLAVEARG